MLKKIIFLFIFIIFAGIANADTLKFAQITDVHTSEQNVKYNGRNLDNSQINLQKAVNAINADNSIQYVFFTGDSVDKADSGLYTIFFNTANKLNKPYYMALGNHDVNYGELSKQEALKIIKQNSYARKSGNYEIPLNDYFTAVILDGTHCAEINSTGYYSKETLNWLDEVLKKDKDKNVLIFQHFPVVEPADDKLYSFPHKILNKTALLKILKKYKNVVLISSGHYHVKGEFNKYGIIHYSTPALFLTPSYYRITTIDYNKNRINSVTSELKENN